MSEKKEDLIKKQQLIIEHQKKEIERLNNSDTKKERNQERNVYKGSVDGVKENKDFEGRVSTGDDD